MPHLRALLALLAIVAVALPSVAGPADLLTIATALGASVVILLLVWQPPHRSAPLARSRTRTLRDRAQRLAFLRTRDPDADGRVRPRAPGQCSAAA